MNTIRWVKVKGAKPILQHYTMVGTNGWGHAVFGWVDVEIIVIDKPKNASTTGLSSSNGRRETP